MVLAHQIPHHAGEAAWRQCLSRVMQVRSITGEELQLDGSGKLFGKTKFWADRNGDRLTLLRGTDNKGRPGKMVVIWMRLNGVSSEIRVTQDSEKPRNSKGEPMAPLAYSSLWKGETKDIVSCQESSFYGRPTYAFRLATGPLPPGLPADFAKMMRDSKMDLLFDKNTHLPLGDTDNMPTYGTFMTRYLNVSVNQDPKTWKLSKAMALKLAKDWLKTPEPADVRSTR